MHMKKESTKRRKEFYVKKILTISLSVLLFISILTIPTTVEAAQYDMNIPGYKKLSQGYAENWFVITEGQFWLYVRAGHTGDNNYVVGSTLKRNNSSILSASAVNKNTVKKGPYKTISMDNLSAYCFEIMAY